MSPFMDTSLSAYVNIFMLMTSYKAIGYILFREESAVEITSKVLIYVMRSGKIMYMQHLIYFLFILYSLFIILKILYYFCLSDKNYKS